jgi:hypothetical protein
MVGSLLSALTVKIEAFHLKASKKSGKFEHPTIRQFSLSVALPFWKVISE